MTESESGQDEANVLIGYPSGQDGPILPARDFPRRSRKKKFSSTSPLLTKLVPQEKVLLYKSFIDLACSVKMAGYWPRSFFVFLLTSTSSLFILKNA